MKNYNTLSEAVNDLQQRGFSYNFNIAPHCIHCADLDIELHPEDFEVEEVYRFEGMSSTDDNSIVYAISSKKGVRGILIDAYGVYAENISERMRRKLR